MGEQRARRSRLGWKAATAALAVCSLLLAVGCAKQNNSSEDGKGGRPSVNTGQEQQANEQGNSQQANNQAHEQPEAGAEQELALLMDPQFKNGFNLLGIRSIETGEQIMAVLNYDQEYGVYPYWRLAQWGTRQSLETAQLETISDHVYRYANETKAVTVNVETGDLTLKAAASQEYGAPRKNGEDWPHLLIEQVFMREGYLDQLSALHAKLDVQLSAYVPQMSEETYNPGLHAAQFSWYITVQNRNSSSSQYGDYFWFGLPIFDNREPLPKESYFKDGGKEDTTHKFIYNMDASHYLQEGLKVGEWATIELDLLPYMLHARDLAFENGFLEGTLPEELAVSNMNLGWELPGTFDVEMNIRNLELRAVLK